MGKTRDLFKKNKKKNWNIKGTFHARMCTIKERNGMNLTETEELKNRQQEYTEELYEKGLNDPENQNGVVTHLELDNMECKLNGP